MSPIITISTILVYLLILLWVSHRSGRNADNEGFFIGNRGNGWPVATLAMIGAAMSGVTFISLPGSVATDSMTYMQMVVGFTVGQLIVAFLLIPLFYRLRVVSLYEYLDHRFGVVAHKTGAWCFLVAKIVAAALKLYVVCMVLQLLVFEPLGMPFGVNLLLTIFFVWLYTHRGGVRALIPTDTIQSACLVGSVVMIVCCLATTMHIDSIGQLCKEITASPYSAMWQFDDASSPRYFWKMVAGGALCLVAMTGLDQDMMQRNMSCRTVRDAQINIVLTALCQIGVIFLLLVLGILLYSYIDYAGLSMPERGDDVFPLVAIYGSLPQVVGVVFVLGLISSTYSAAGSALTSLTTSFTLDIMPRAKALDEENLARLRRRIHLFMAVAVTLLILLFRAFAEGSVINLIFTLAGYTYGPILGLFAFGMLSSRQLHERYVPIIAIASPLVSGLLQWLVAEQFDYHIGFELIGYNALFAFAGLWLISHKRGVQNK